MIEGAWDVYKTLEMKDGAIFKTQKIKTIWIPLGKGPKNYAERLEIAKQHGGDQLQPNLATRKV